MSSGVCLSFFFRRPHATTNVRSEPKSPRNRTEVVQETVPSRRMLASLGIGLVTIGAGIVELVRWLVTVLQAAP